MSGGATLLNNAANVDVAINTAFLVIMGILVFAMQGAFAFLEAGSVRAKNTTNILVKNTVDTAIGALIYWATGFAFAYGGNGNGFIGYNKFFLINTDASEYQFYFYSYVFAVTSATIVSGAVAERTRLSAYFIFTLIITGFTYPVVTHWVWSENGWLNQLDFVDYAGSCCVHVVGGSAALVGSIIVGPRTGRFVKGKIYAIPGHSTVLITIGYFVLSFGFLAFNAGSEQGVSGSYYFPERVARAAVNTSLAGASSFLVTLLIYKFGFSVTEVRVLGKEFKMVTALGGKWCLSGAINGGITGNAAICASCFAVEPWAAVVIGCVAGAFYCLFARLVLLFRIDDPLSASAVHLSGGIWGTVAAGLFIHHDRLASLPNGGILYGWDGDAFIFFGIQAIGCACVFAWTAANSALIFGVLRLLGLLRVTKEEEEEGLDFKNGEPAYPIDPAILANVTPSTELDSA